MPSGSQRRVDVSTARSRLQKLQDLVEQDRCMSQARNASMSISTDVNPTMQ
jgi:hypothetical protein